MKKKTKYINHLDFSNSSQVLEPLLHLVQTYFQLEISIRVDETVLFEYIFSISK